MLSPSLYSVFKNAKNTISNFQEHIFGSPSDGNTVNIGIENISPIPTPLPLVEQEVFRDLQTTTTTISLTACTLDPLGELCRLVRFRLLKRQVPLCCDKCKIIIIKNIKIISSESLSLTTLGNSLCKSCRYLFISDNPTKKRNISFSIHPTPPTLPAIKRPRPLSTTATTLPSPPPSCTDVIEENDDLVLDVVGFTPPTRRSSTGTKGNKLKKKTENSRKKRKVSYDDNLLISYEPSLSLSNSIRRRSFMVPLVDVNVLTPSFREMEYPPARPFTLDSSTKGKDAQSKEYSRIHNRYELVEKKDRLCSPGILKSLAIKKK